MAIPLKMILTIIATLLQMIAEGMSEAEAINIISSRYGVSKELLRKYL
ncbi:hypothetical protein QBE52_11295 [Clostridiaceae bacterium 35-E11]